MLVNSQMTTEYLQQIHEETTVQLQLHTVSQNINA